MGKRKQSVRVWREGKLLWLEHIDQQIPLRNFWELVMELAFRLGEVEIYNEIRKRRYKVSQEEFLQMLENIYGRKKEDAVEEPPKKKRRNSRSKNAK